MRGEIRKAISKVLLRDFKLKDDELDFITNEGIWRFGACSLFVLLLHLFSEENNYSLTILIILSSVMLLNYIARLILKREGE